MLYILEIVGRITVKSEFTYWDKRVIRMRPDLSNIKNVPPIFHALLLRHNLD